MEAGPFITGMLTGLREGVEAALIVSIILAYLARTGNRHHFGRIWLGVGAAVVLSVGIGLVLFVTIGELGEPAEQIFEGLAMFLAAGVVTWMLFWMRRTAANIRGELESGIERALTDGGVMGLSILAFTAVIREGIETALFLMGQATAAGEGAASTLIGAIVGLALAVGIGYALYRGARVINLRTFFTWTGVGLIFIAAGLLSHGIHEFIEAGLITIGTAPAFDLSALLPHEGNLLGELLRAVFGYSSQPEWITFLAWLGYVVIVLALYLLPLRPATASSAAPHANAPTNA